MVNWSIQMVIYIKVNMKTVRNKVKAYDYGYPDSLAIQEHTRDYYSVITELDGFLGKLFDYLEKQELMGNTYIFFMSDNGWMLGDHGFTSKVLPYNTSTNVPFWIVGHDIPTGSNSSLVSNLDILPTLLDLANIPLPENLHGKSLKPILKDSIDRVRDFFVYEGIGSYGGSKKNLTVLKDGFRYIVTYEDDSLTKKIFTELYHQKNDVAEMHNLIEDRDYETLTMEMDDIITDYRKSILNELH